MHLIWWYRHKKNTSQAEKNKSTTTTHLNKHSADEVNENVMNAIFSFMYNMRFYKGLPWSHQSSKQRFMSSWSKIEACKRTCPKACFLHATWCQTTACRSAALHIDFMLGECYCTTLCHRSTPRGAPLLTNRHWLWESKGTRERTFESFCEQWSKAMI